MLEARLWLLHRATAALMAPFVLVHLGLMIFAVQGGLDAAEILGRTRGSLGWGAFYGVFAIAAAMHGSLGLRTVLREWAGWHGRTADMVLLALFLGLSAIGLRAVVAVVG